jgi:hypothetical protein
MKRTHIIEFDGSPIFNPFLARDKETYNPGDTLIIEQPDTEQQAFSVDFVARNKVNKGWCYLLLHEAKIAPVLTINDLPDSVGGGYGKANEITG